MVDSSVAAELVLDDQRQFKGAHFFSTRVRAEDFDRGSPTCGSRPDCLPTRPDLCALRLYPRRPWDNAPQNNRKIGNNLCLFQIAAHAGTHRHRSLLKWERMGSLAGRNAIKGGDLEHREQTGMFPKIVESIRLRWEYQKPRLSPCLTNTLVALFFVRRHVILRYRHARSFQ